MTGALVIVSLVLVLSLYAIGQLLVENTRLRSHIEERAKKLAKWQEYNDRNKAMAQVVLDRISAKRKAEQALLKEEQAKRFDADEGLRICSMELRTTENLLARKSRRYSTGIL